MKEWTPPWFCFPDYSRCLRSSSSLHSSPTTTLDLWRHTTTVKPLPPWNIGPSSRASWKTNRERPTFLPYWNPEVDTKSNERQKDMICRTILEEFWCPQLLGTNSFNLDVPSRESISQSPREMSDSVIRGRRRRKPSKVAEVLWTWARPRKICERGI